MQISRTTIDFRETRRLLDDGRRVMLFIRHSERPPICTSDRDFGKNLGLTDKGVAMAVEAGSRFTGIEKATFFASPMARCRLTAKHMAEGMGMSQSPVIEAPQIGVEGFYMHPDSYALQALMKERGYMRFMEDYLNNGSAPYLNDIKPATLQTIDWMRGLSREGLTVFVSHDIYITAFLTALGVRSFSEKDWIGFLHAAVLSEDPGTGELTCFHAVPCLKSHTEPAKFAH